MPFVVRINRFSHGVAHMCTSLYEMLGFILWMLHEQPHAAVSQKHYQFRNEVTFIRISTKDDLPVWHNGVPFFADS